MSPTVIDDLSISTETDNFGSAAARGSAKKIIAHAIAANLFILKPVTVISDSLGLLKFVDWLDRQLAAALVFCGGHAPDCFTCRNSIAFYFPCRPFSRNRLCAIRSKPAAFGVCYIDFRGDSNLLVFARIAASLASSAFFKTSDRCRNRRAWRRSARVSLTIEALQKLQFFFPGDP